MTEAQPDPTRAGAASGRTILYNSVGDTVTRWEVDVEAATLTRCETSVVASVVQYGWPHPDGGTLYLASTDSERGSRGITGSRHLLTALAIGPDGTLSMRGAPKALRQRPIHTSVDRAGRFALTCYNAPSHLTVHRIEPDGSLGDLVEQPPGLNLGVFCHQILAMPSNQSVLVVTRGNQPSAAKPRGDPGALKTFGFDEGRLTPWTSIAPGGGEGFNYGPRHGAFHPDRPWLYILVELQNRLDMHRLAGDAIQPDPSFSTALTAAPPQPGIKQVGGAIHVHPDGHVLYATNRVSATTQPDGPFPLVGGENNIAVFALDPATGEPHPIQFADPHGFHIRSFAIDPSGRLLVAACLAPMTLGDAPDAPIIPAGLSVFRIAADGRLTFARRYPVATPPGVQQMWVLALALPAAL